MTSGGIQAAGGRRTLILGLAGALLLALAHPPAGLAWLAWIAPVPWLLVVRAEPMPGRRPYRVLWFAGFVHWLITVQWLRLAHPANYAALTFIAAYLGCYLPVFVAIARIGVHRFRVPLWIAAPVAWTGLEWLRARLLTGFLMASLAHTQIRNSAVIQIADIFGEYGVSFLVMLVAGSIAEAINRCWIDPPPAESTIWDVGTRRLGGGTRRAFAVLRRLMPGAIALIAAITYAMVRQANDAATTSENKPQIAHVALIQSDMLADWKGNDQRDEAVMRQQMELSIAAARSSDAPLDLVVWPETMFRTPMFVRDEKNPPPENSVNPANYEIALTDLAAVAKRVGAPVLAGLDRIVASSTSESARPGPGGSDAPPYTLVGRNAVVCVDRAGQVIGTYDKMHLLPFGEYVPLAEWLPFLSSMTPITGSAISGDAPAMFEVNGVRYSPSICYETVLPQLMRRQFVELAAADRAPDVLVNVTNDAWYWGSSELDMHLASGVFRAVELRRPMVIAANRGLSAHIDRMGRVVKITERDKPAYLVCDVEIRRGADAQPTFYARWGDWLPLSCLICSMALIALRRASPAGKMAKPALDA